MRSYNLSRNRSQIWLKKELRLGFSQEVRQVYRRFIGHYVTNLASFAASSERTNKIWNAIGKSYVKSTINGSFILDNCFPHCIVSYSFSFGENKSTPIFVIVRIAKRVSMVWKLHILKLIIYVKLVYVRLCNFVITCLLYLTAVSQ